MSAPLRLILALFLLDTSPRDALRLYGFTVVSVGAHAVAFLLLLLLPHLSWFDEPEAIAVELITIDETEPEVVEPEVVEPEVEESEPDPEPVVRRERREPLPDEPPPPAQEEEPPPLDETVADFTGETLTNETGLAWASAVGNGQAIEAPLGRPGAVVTGRERRGARDGVIGGRGRGEGTELVPIANLSRRPGPPMGRLEELVGDTYPRQARNLGIEGSARVRVRVERDGRVRTLAVLSEDHEGFGRACREAIRRGGRWVAPLDRSGDAVPTITTFRCTFRVN